MRTSLFYRVTPALYVKLKVNIFVRFVIMCEVNKDEHLNYDDEYNDK